MKTEIARLFADIDSLDVDRFVAHLAPDVVMQFGNGPEMKGRAAVQEAISGFFTQIAGLRHELHAYCETDDAQAVQITVHYTRLDQSIVSVPVAVFLHRESGALIRDYRIYIDLAPLFQPAATALKAA